MSKPNIFNEMESVEVAANLTRDAETGGDHQGLEDVNINIDPVDDVATATSNKTSSTSSKVKGLFYLGGVACGAAAGFAYGGVEINKAGAVQSQMADVPKASKAPAVPKTTKAPKGACPASGSGGNKCLSDERKKTLQSDFGIPIIIDANGCDKLDNTFVQGEGFAVDAPPGGNTVTINALKKFSKVVGTITGYAFPISDFECIDEVYALGVNACNDNPDCTYFSVKEEYGVEKNSVALFFWSQESVTAQTTYPDGTYLGASEETEFPALRNAVTHTTFIKTGETPPPDFPSVHACVVPDSTQLPLAVGCAVNPTISPKCGDLLTPDFLQYIAPAAGCLDNIGKNVTACLLCLSKFSSKLDCNSGQEVCEEDNAKNFITAMPCKGGVQTDCVCDACGDVCGTQCKAQIQTSISCQQGATFDVVENEKGVFVTNGSCLNSRIVSGSKDFSCPSSD